MKIDKNFKMDKQSKRMLSTVVDKQERATYRSLLIDAQISRDRSRHTHVKEKETE
jgi:hypothetical protein